MFDISSAKGLANLLQFLLKIFAIFIAAAEEPYALFEINTVYALKLISFF